MTAPVRAHSATALPAGTTAGGNRGSLALLGACGVGLAATLALGLLLPMSLWRNPHNFYAGAPMVPMYGDTLRGATWFGAATVLLGAFWAGALLAADRLPATPRLLWATIAASACFCLILLPMNPGGTQDIYHNIADARLFWLYDINPTKFPPNTMLDDPLIREAWGYADLPSAYGPLWYILAGLPLAVAGDGLVANLVAQKALMALLLVATTAVVVLAVRRIAPERALLAAVLTGWCPLLLFEAAGNGHNDVALALPLGAAFLAATSRRFLLVLPLLALSVLVKYVTVLLGPAVLLWMLRAGPEARRAILPGAALAAALTALAFVPFWEGADTVAAADRPGMTFILSPATLLHGVLVRWFDDATASTYARWLTGGLFALCLAALLNVDRDVDHLAAVCFDLLFAYLLLASWWFWPWYLTWCAPVVAISRGCARSVAFALATITAMLTYLYWWPDPLWRTGAWFAWYTAITIGVFVVPGAVWLSSLAREWRRARLAMETS